MVDNLQEQNPDKKNFLVDGNSEIDAFPFLREFDIIKFFAIVKKSIPWIIIFFSLSLTGAYLFLRYTKTVYKSSSILKLDMKTEAEVAGLDQINQNASRRGANFSQLSGEIELIKSKLIYDKVIDALGLAISYYTYGNVLHEEKYKSSPFVVQYEIANNDYLDKPFNVDFIDGEHFHITYDEISKEGDTKSVTKKNEFGDWIITDDFKFKLAKTKSFGDWAFNQGHFFRVNSNNYLNNYIEKNLTVQILNADANTIQISFEDNNKLKTKEIVEAFDSIYLVTTVDAKQKAQIKTINFLNEQLESTEDKLRNAEEGLQDFIKRHKTIDVKEEVSKVVEQMEHLEEIMLDLRIHLNLINKLSALVNTNASDEDFEQFIPTLIEVENPQLVELTIQLNQSIREKKQLLMSHNANTQVVQEKEVEINALKENLVELMNQNKDVLLDRMQQVRGQILKLNQFFLVLPEKDSEYTRIKRYFDLYEKFYLLLMEKKAEFEIAKAGIVPEFVVLSPANLPTEPIYPIQLYIYLSGAGLGFFISLLFVITKYLMYNTISSPKDLSKILIGTILGGIPTYRTEKLPLSKLIANRNPKSVITESLRSIRTNIEFMVDKQKKVISITSTISGEGKTFVSLNLGGVIAMSQSKVLLIDLDMRKPKIAKAFEISNDKGMSTMIIGKHKMEECIHKTEIENFHFIPAGPTPPNPTELILKPEFDQLIEQFKEHYDTIIIDTPPAGLVTDAVIVMQKVDLPIYVVRANYSKILFARNINELVRSHKFSNLSVIINAVEEMNVYGYGYYSYGYGSSGYYEDVEEELGGILGFLKKLLGK